jgi:hypothetical protein
MAKYVNYSKNGLQKVGRSIFTLDFSDFPYFKRILIEKIGKSIWYDGHKINITSTQIYGNKQAIKDVVRQAVEEMDEATIALFKTLEKGYEPNEMRQRKYLLDSIK